MPYTHLDNPPASVAVDRVGNGAAFQFRVTCTACGQAEQTFSPTEADAIVQEYARHTHRYEAPGCDGNDGAHSCSEGPLRRIPLTDNQGMILCSNCFDRMRKDDSSLGTWTDHPRYEEV